MAYHRKIHFDRFGMDINMPIIKEEKARPMLIAPAFRAYPWGGDRLWRDFGKETDVRPLAESWEISCHEGGLCVVASGEYAGTTLRDVLAENPEWIHAKAQRGEEFPILIKLIDAQRTLALQVHPDDDYARRMENSLGKTEMWFVMDAQPGAGVYYGFKENVTQEQVRKAMGTQALCDLLSFIEVRAGDVFFIPAGIVHAIGEGLLVAEVQQSSDITYRLYDFGYLGPDGKPREMHTDKGLAVARISPADGFVRTAQETDAGDQENMRRLVECEHFAVSLLNVSGDLKLQAAKNSFHALLCLEGACRLCFRGEDILLEKGRSAFVPAGIGEYRLSGCAQVLLSERGKKG